DSSRLRSLWSLVNLLNSLQFLLLALNCSSKWGLGLVKGVEILGHASEVGTSQIIAHAGSGRSGIDVRGAAARLDIVNVYGAEVDTESSTARRIWDTGVHLCGRK